MQAQPTTALPESTRIVNFKSSRRTERKPQAKTLRLFEQIYAVARDYDRMTVRQLFYQLVVRGHIEKTERAYARVQEATVAMRRGKLLPYDKIVDGGRVRRRQPGWDSIGDLLGDAEAAFRLDHWQHQPVLVEIWCEKDALAGVIQPVADRYGVTFVALKGFGSLSIAAESGAELRRAEKPVVIYYFGDHDPSGWAVSQSIEAELQDHLGDALSFVRYGLDPADIAMYRLPTRAPKPGDGRLAAFVEAFGSPDCVELDALPPDVLTGWVKDVIEHHIDRESWERVQLAEVAQRSSLAGFIATFEDLDAG